MSEYPKVIEVDGIKITATDAEDEARWLAAPPPPASGAADPVLVPEPLPDEPPAEAPSEVSPEAEEIVEPVDPLDDVTVEMDNPDFAAKPGGKSKKKK